jgi:hypothetical protein
MKSANKRETLEALANGWRLRSGCFGLYLTSPKDEQKRDVRLDSGDALVRAKLIKPKQKIEWWDDGKEWEINK